LIITVDGPSGSGKTTLALMIAQHFNFFCLNSGYLYRGLAYVLKNVYGYDQDKMKNPDIQDINAILQSGNFRYEYALGLTKIYWVDEITMFLKDPEISKLSAFIAQQNEVRLLLREYENGLVSGKDIVIEGRACGSVVYPHADIKFYITASPEIRAFRLQRDQLKRGKLLTLPEAMSQINVRDEMDKNRPVEPLAYPQGAIVLDSSKLTANELLQQALREIEMQLHKH
jgi:CMP/dCMP kinase